MMPIPIQLIQHLLFPIIQSPVIHPAVRNCWNSDHEIGGRTLHGTQLLETVFEKLKNEGSHLVLLYIDNLNQPKHLEMLLPHAKHFSPG
jgi:hypothetical protein